MVSDVVLGNSFRNNLSSIVQTQRTLDNVQLRLATGLRVNSALDNPQNFFAAQSLDNRASDLQRLLDGVGQSIRTIQVADNGIDALSDLVEQAEAVALEAVELNRRSETEARVLGDRNLQEVADLTQLGSVNAGDQLLFTFRQEDAINFFPVQSAVTINAGDTAEELAVAIENLNIGQPEDVIDASIDINGRLELRALNGNILNVQFDSSAGAAQDFSLATALGFGDIAQSVLEGFPFPGGPEVEFTVVPGRQIESFQLFDAATDRVARRSDRFIDLEGENNTAIFFLIDNVLDQLELGVNGGPRENISLAPDTTIQGLIDLVNNGSLGDLLEADFDETEGRIILRAIDDAVESIETALVSDAVALAFFGFNVTAPVNFINEDVDTIRLGTVAGPSDDEIRALEIDFDKILQQIDNIVQDAQYRGINLLDSDNLQTFFSEDRRKFLEIEGADFTFRGLGFDEADFSTLLQATQRVDQAREALNTIRDFGQSIASDLSIIETRQDFARQTINTLSAGGDDLTVADANEEGANLLAVQTRQAIAVSVLSSLGAAQRSVLSLFA